MQSGDAVSSSGALTPIFMSFVPSGIVYWTVLGRGSQFGSIKRAYMTTFDDQGSNPVKEVNLNLRYIAKPDGIAVDWIGGYETLGIVICARAYVHYLRRSVVDTCICVSAISIGRMLVPTGLRCPS